MKFKKALCAVMAGVTALTSVVMTVPAAAEDTKTFGDFEYKIDGSKVTITNYIGDDSNVYIPNFIDDREVTTIGNNAFKEKSVEHVRFPAYLETIGSNAFCNCKDLQEAVLPQSLKLIKDGAFSGSGIADVVFGGDVKITEYGVSGTQFAFCDNLQTVTLYPSSENTYSHYYTASGLKPFSGCNNISDVYYFGKIADMERVRFTDFFFTIGNETDGYGINYYALDADEDDSIQKFDPRDTHSIVTFDPNSGTGGTKLYALKNQQVSEPVPPEKKDCEFVGWYTNPEGKGEPWDFVMDRVSSDMTLYAKYRPLQFSVTFDAQGGSCDVKQKDYSFGLAMGELPVPTRTNYQFIGWYSRADGNGDLYTNSTIMPRSDTKLYAAWLQEGKSLVVDFSGNGGELDSEKVLVPYNTAISSFPNATRKGCTFVEWNSKADGTGDTYNKNTKVIHNNLTLYAIWKTKSPTVTLDPNKGTVSKDSFTVKYNTAIGNIPAPKRDGYEFTGWYYQDGRKFSSTDKMPDKDIMLTAKWRGFEYMILFDAKKGTMPGEDTMYASCGDKIGKLPVPVRKGYEFTGWYTKSNGKGTKYTADSEMPEKDLTLYAGWKKITQYATAVKFNAKSVTVGVGESVALNAVTTPVLTLDKLTWSSTNTKVATVSEKGVITGKSAGKATVKVTTSKGKPATIKIVVKKAATSLKVPYSTRTIKTGQTVKATATANGYTGTLKWSSSAPAVAKVDQEGNITGLKAGKCVITVKTYNGVQSKITITVK